MYYPFCSWKATTQRERERERVRVRVRVREGPELERVFEGRHWREPRRAGQKPQEISM